MGSVFLNKKTGSWVIKFKDNRDKWRKRSVGKKPAVTKSMAREILREYERKIKLGQFDMIDTKIPTLKEITPDYLKYQASRGKRSIRGDIKHLEDFNKVFGDMKLSQIHPKDIDDYKNIRIKQIKPSSLNRELSTLRHLFNVAKRWKKFFGENPVSEAGLLTVNNNVERILTWNEQQRLLEVSPPHLKNILEFALNTAMRIGEIVSLEWDNINFTANTITIESENSKNKRTEKIPLSSTVRKLLLELKMKSLDSEYVFLNSENKPYQKPDSLNNVYRTALKRAGIEGLRFHDLRHTAATRMIESGISIVSVSKILRHRDLKTTMRYMHPDNSLVEAVESLANYQNPNSNGHDYGHSAET